MSPTKYKCDRLHKLSDFSFRFLFCALVAFDITGDLYYAFNGDKLIDGFPIPITTLGLPPSLRKIDAILVWGHNSHTYIFSGTQYWW